MKLSIHWNGLAADEGLRAHLERRLAFALARFGDEVSEIRARFADLNGPRGGIDKEVKLYVRGRRLATQLVTALDSNMHAAIDRASDRVGTAVARTLERGNRPWRKR